MDSARRESLLHKNRTKMYDECDAYRRSFIDPQTGFIRDELLESRNCPCCNGNKLSTLFIKNGGTYVKCSECSMVFLNPVFKDQSLTTYYEGNNVAQATAHCEETDFYKSIYELGLSKVASFVQEGKLLDIGCSSGLFLDISRNNGYETHGIELNKAEFGIVQSKGHIVWNESLEQITFSDAFDVVTLWDVFEHIKNGVDYLRRLKSILSESGCLFMQIPSADSIAARILHEKCNMFDGIEHVNLYNRLTIEKVAHSAGFSIVSIDSVIDELAPIANHLSYQEPYAGSFPMSSIEQIFDRKHILSSGLGYKLQIVLRPS